jgi:urea transport system ATP-binding protein
VSREREVLLETSALRSGYGSSVVVHDLDLQVAAGEVVAVMGRNGVGKSTLLKTLMGVLGASGGSIAFGGDDVTRWAADRRSRAGIGYVPQGREIFPFLTVSENLYIGLEARRRSRSQAPAWLFELFPDLAGIMNRNGGDLSGGQQQQLAIARVLITGPRLVLLDEPTEGIQPSIVQDIERAIREIRDQGELAILLVEQSLDFALRLADRVYVMDHGHFVHEGRAGAENRAIVESHLML